MVGALQSIIRVLLRQSQYGLDSVRGAGSRRAASDPRVGRTGRPFDCRSEHRGLSRPARVGSTRAGLLCNCSSVRSAGTSTRRQIAGSVPSRVTLICLRLLNDVRSHIYAFFDLKIGLPRPYCPGNVTRSIPSQGLRHQRCRDADLRIREGDGLPWPNRDRARRRSILVPGCGPWQQGGDRRPTG